MKQKSFTILEVLLAITILTVAVGASYALIQRTVIAASIVQSRLAAAYLAQEGIEIVRNLRDSNWLAGEPWHTGIWTETASCYEGDYNDSELTELGLVDCEFANRNFLRVDSSNGYYNYSLGEPTSFKRKITVDKLADDSLKVSVLVDWTSRGTVYKMDEVVDYLYNWY